MNNDIPNHVAGKVKRALDDGHQIAADSGEMLRIALLAAGVCIGQAAGLLQGMLDLEGNHITERQAKEQIMELLTTLALEGAAAAWAELQVDASL